MSLAATLSATVALGCFTAVVLTAGVIQASTRKVLYVELQTRLELSLQQVRSGAPLTTSDVRYTTWQVPLPEQGDLILQPPVGMNAMPKWRLTPSQVTRLKNGQAIFATQGPDLNVQRVLIVPSRGNRLEATYANLTQIDRHLSVLRNAQILALIAVTFFTVTLAYLILQTQLRPLRMIIDHLRTLDPRAPGPPAELPDATGELHDLVVAYNSMARRTRAVVETQDNFVRDAGHELRTPLTSMIGHAGFLLRRTELTDQQRESLTVIRDEGERFSRLLTDLLALSRNHSTAPRADIDLRDLAGRVVRNLSSTSLSRVQAQVHTPDEPVTVLASSDQLTQVLSNLLNNATQAHATTVTVGVQRTATHATVTVTDNGSGISQENLDRIFERFYRTNDSRDRNAGGNGLGLSIARNILHAHGGEITVDSRLGSGTQFTLTLPLSA